ncbi:hypothetical protein BDW69DRAFT_169202 [Aspergillus filifer]
MKNNLECPPKDHYRVMLIFLMSLLCFRQYVLLRIPHLVFTNKPPIKKDNSP